MLNGTADNDDLRYTSTSSRNNGTATFAPGGDLGRGPDRGRQRPAERAGRGDHATKLYNPSANATLQGGEATLSRTGVILDDDDDGAGSNLALFVSDPVLVEGDSGATEAVFDVVLSRPASSDLRLSYRTEDISATAGQDYTGAAGSLLFRAGQSTAEVRVPVSSDTAAEASERFALIVTPPKGGCTT